MLMAAGREFLNKTKTKGVCQGSTRTTRRREGEGNKHVSVDLFLAEGNASDGLESLIDVGGLLGRSLKVGNVVVGLAPSGSPLLRHLLLLLFFLGIVSKDESK